MSPRGDVRCDGASPTPARGAPPRPAPACDRSMPPRPPRGSGHRARRGTVVRSAARVASTTNRVAPAGAQRPRAAGGSSARAKGTRVRVYDCRLNHIFMTVPVSIVASIRRCHRRDRGSIPRQEAFWANFFAGWHVFVRRAGLFRRHCGRGRVAFVVVAKEFVCTRRPSSSSAVRSLPSPFSPLQLLLFEREGLLLLVGLLPLVGRR